MTRFTDGRVPDSGMAEVFSPERRCQRYLDVEAALALAEAELGVIPYDAGPAIAAAAHVGNVDLARVEQGMAASSHPLMPLIVELSRVVGEPHGGWVHWGATTQNITQTADVLGLREAHRILILQLADVFDAAATLAERGIGMVMAGRTHGQQAVPITFGFKTAAWIDQLLRHLQRLEELRERLLMAMMGGAAGTFASLGTVGPAVQAAVARRLGLGTMPVPARSIADPFAELVCVLGMLASSTGAIAGEIYTLMTVEFGEVAEPAPPGVIGSSTMPHKQNPQLCQDMLTISAQIRALVPLALEGMAHGHEADGARTEMTEAAVSGACVLAADQLARLYVVLAGLELDPDRMRSNLMLTGGLIMSEAVMLALGATIGRQVAHEVVRDAALTARFTGRDFADVLAEDPRVHTHLDEAQIVKLVDPHAHTGLSDQIAEEAAGRARDAASAARRGESLP
jgi:3-carboxy-cis,cis-muconate cycloisomerase